MTDFIYSADMFITTAVALLVLLIIPEGSSQGDQSIIRRCRCIIKEKKPIGRYIAKVTVHPASSHCNEMEIIATLKNARQEICLDPNAPWVKKVLAKRLVEQRP
ncbi:hypothetical protein INR49_030887 [Caranx melampygus]|nr:hypothetical protein INR49_030887 [Caranx melampygus]